MADVHLRGLHPELSAPISQIIYVLCKVRRRKVIVKFFRNDAQLLQPLLLYFSPCFNSDAEKVHKIWEEEFVGLLWLAHILSGPFALANAVDPGALHVKPLDPNQRLDVLPSRIGKALIYIAKFYLSSSGQQRTAAGILLGQLVKRRDLQDLNFHSAILSWSIEVVTSENVSSTVLSYCFVGHLSFWVQYVRAAMGERRLRDDIPHLWFSSIEAYVDDVPTRRLLTSQTSLLKLVRYFAHRTAWPANAPEYEDMIQGAIRLQFEELENPTTMVRYQAGKAIGHIEASQDDLTSGEILEFLFANIESDWSNWEDLLPEYGRLLEDKDPFTKIVDSKSFLMPSHDLWHGHLLALAHMLMLKAMPSEWLSKCCQLVSVALNFCQISASGVFMGENVRDAACWCVWALARKYTDIGTIQNGSDSFIQTLATELMQVACLDPVNNIRRAASAALQELIGRNPSKIRFGLELSTIVDSNGVSAGTSGMLMTAPRVSRLSDEYWQVVVQWLCSWRGIGHKSLAIRRIAAQSLGLITFPSSRQIEIVVGGLVEMIRRTYDPLTRHGIMMALASTLKTLHQYLHKHEKVEGLQKASIHSDSHQKDLYSHSIVISPDLFAVLSYEASQLSSHRNNLATFESYEEAKCVLLREIANLILCKSSLPVQVPDMSEANITQHLESAREAFVHPEDRVRELALSAAYSLMRLSTLPARLQFLKKSLPEVEQGNIELLADSSLRLLGLAYDLFSERESHQGSKSLAQQSIVDSIIASASSQSIALKCAAMYALRVGPLKHGCTLSFVSLIDR